MHCKSIFFKVRFLLLITASLVFEFLYNIALRPNNALQNSAAMRKEP